MEGSQAGTLTTTFEARNNRWEPGFPITCSKNDKLTFKICQESEDKKDQRIVATAIVHSSNVIDIYQKNLKNGQGF